MFYKDFLEAAEYAGQARCDVYNRLFIQFGISDLLDGEIVENLVRYAEMSRHASWDREGDT